MGGPTVVLAYQYDSAGHRTQMAATIDGTADFVDDYVYDSLGRVVSVTEHGVEGGNAVADKTIDFTYNDAGQIVSIERYEGTELVVTADYAYDSSGRLTGLLYHQGTTVLNSYAWTYSGDSSSPAPIPNPQSPIPSSWLPTGGLMPIHNTSGVASALASGGLAGLDLLTGVTSSDGTATYTYDATGQLTGVTCSSSNPQSLIPNPSESYSYDANGNRTGSGYVVGTGNRLLSDGTYTYAYDAEGNRTARFIDADQSGTLTAGDTQLTEYTWDARNRLVEVAERAAVGGAATEVVDYLYDVEDRWIGENIDNDGDGQFDHATRFAYDGNQIALQFDKDVSGAPGSANPLAVANLSHRYLWEPGVVDQLLADERTQLDANDNVATDELLWALTDQQGTVHDVARSDGTTTSVVNHVVYESYGTIVSQSDSAQGTLFGFTGRPLDTATGLQNNWHRWYTDAGWWLSQDPLSFTAGDANTSRYVGGHVTVATDPNGMEISLLIVSKDNKIAPKDQAWQDAVLKCNEKLCEKVAELEAMPESVYNELRRKHKIMINGRPRNLTKDQFIARVVHEMQSRIQIQTAGGFAKAKANLEALFEDEGYPPGVYCDYDAIGIAGHGVAEDYKTANGDKVKIPDGTMVLNGERVNQDEATAAFREIGKYYGEKLVIYSCYNNLKEKIERMSIVGAEVELGWPVKTTFENGKWTHSAVKTGKLNYINLKTYRLRKNYDKETYLPWDDTYETFPK